MDSFSRLIICVQVPSLFPQEIVDAFNRRRVAFMGIPRYVIRDGGPCLAVRSRGRFADAFNLALVKSPTKEPAQMGAIERHVGLLEISLTLIESGKAALSLREVLRQACVAINYSPVLSSGYVPVQIVFGRANYFSGSPLGCIFPNANAISDEGRRRQHLLTLLKARLAIMSADATKRHRDVFDVRFGYGHRSISPRARRFTYRWMEVGMMDGD